jgi:hypothetical protein
MFSLITSLFVVFGITAIFAKSIVTIISAIIGVKSFSIVVSSIILSFAATIKILRFLLKNGGD